MTKYEAHTRLNYAIDRIMEAAIPLKTNNKSMVILLEAIREIDEVRLAIGKTGQALEVQP